MTFWTIVIALGLAWVVQSWLSFKQTQRFTKLFVELRRKGRVAMGKFRGGIVAGSIVMLVIDDDDRVLEGHRLGGVTVLARFKPLDIYNGQYVGMIDPDAVAPLGRPVVRAVTNLRHNYEVVMGGGTPAEPPTAFSRLIDKLPGIKPKERNLPSPVAAAPRKKVLVRRQAT